MALVRLQQAAGTVDLTSAVEVLNYTPDASNPRLCKVLVKLGDATNPLDGTGGDFLLFLSVGGRYFNGESQVRSPDSGSTTAIFQTHHFVVPAAEAVIVEIQSPNAADTSVAVVAELYDVPTGNMIELDDSGTAASNLADVVTGQGDSLGTNVHLSAAQLKLYTNDAGDAAEGALHLYNAGNYGLYASAGGASSFGMAALGGHAGMRMAGDRGLDVEGTVEADIELGGGGVSDALGNLMAVETQEIDSTAETSLASVVNTTLSSSHGAGSWEDAGGTSSISVMPWAARIFHDGASSPVLLTGYQHANLSATITLVDANGDAINLTGKNLLLIAWPIDEPASPVLWLKNFDGKTELAVSGTGGNTVTISGGASQLTEPADLLWVLRNKTDEVVVAEGRLTVKQAAEEPA